MTVTAAVRRAGPAAAALLVYFAFGGALLWPALFGDQVLSASASFVRDGPFPPEVSRAAPEVGLDCLSDSVHCFVPWLRFAADAYAADGRIPLWKPTAAAGAPFVGNGQAAAYFPTHLLAMLLGAPPIAQALLALSRLAGGAFCAWLLARHLGLSFAGALLAGLAFGFGGFQMGFHLHAVTNVTLLLPLLVLAADRVVLAPTGPRVALLAAVAALQHLGGHPESAFHGQVAVVLLVGARAVGRRREIGRAGAVRAWLAVIAGLALGLGLAAIQVLPLLEYLRHSAALAERSRAAPLALLGHPAASLAFGVALLLALVALRRLVACETGLARAALALLGATTVALYAGLSAGLVPSYILLLGPDWFGGPLDYVGPGVYIGESAAFVGAALPVAALGLLRGRPRGPVLAAGACALLGLLAGSTAPLVDDLFKVLPVFDIAFNARLSLLASLGLAVLAGFGLDALGVPVARGRPRARLVLVVLAPVLGGVAALTLAARDGTVASRNAPRPLADVAVVQARLVPDRLAAPLFADAPAPVGSRAFHFVVPDASPHDGVRVTYGRGASLAAIAWRRAPPGPGPAALPATDLRVYRATVPVSELLPEPTRLRVELLSGGSTVAQSGLVAPAAPGDSFWPFPARPAPGWTTPFGLSLIAAALVLLLLAPRAVPASHVAPAPRVAPASHVAPAPRGAPASRAVTALRAALPLLVAASLWPFDAGLVPLLPARLFHPPSPALEVLASGPPDGRMLASPGVALAPEIPTFYGIADLGSYDALGPARVVRLRDAALAGRDGPDLPLLGLMAVRHLVTRAPPPAGLVALPVPGPLAVAENPHALPRARLVPAASVEADDTRALQLMRRADFPRERSVVLAWGAGREAPAGAVAGSARIVRDRPDEVVVEVEPATPSWLVLADTWFPGWVARVDGTPREIVRAHVAFRAVEVGPGERTVTFRYEPLSHRAGTIVSSASALAALALLAAGALSRRGAASGRRRPWLRPGAS